MFKGIFWWFTDGFLCSLIFRQSHKKHLGDITNQNWGHVRKKAIWKTCKIWEWNPGWVNRKGEWLAKWNNVSQHGHFFSRPQTTDSFTLVLQAKSSRVCVTETSYLGLSWPHQFWRFAPGRVALQGYFRDRHRALRARPLKGSGRPQLSPAPQALGSWRKCGANVELPHCWTVKIW